MALPLSGPISLNDIRTELGVATKAPFGLMEAETGATGYPAINQGSTYKPSGTAPHQLSNWYGYDHSASTQSCAHTWNFNTDGNAENWSAGGNVHSWAVSGGVYICESNGTDPYTYSPDNLNTTGSSYKKVKARFKLVDTKTINVAVYFITTGDGNFDGNKVVDLNVSFNNDFQEVTIDMSNHTTWTSGTIRRIRFDMGNSSGRYEIDWISICNY